MTLRQTIQMECPVCNQPMDQTKDQDEVNVTIFGVKRYGFCIGCHQIVNEPWTKPYRKRWEKKLRDRVK